MNPPPRPARSVRVVAVTYAPDQGLAAVVDVPERDVVPLTVRMAAGPDGTPHRVTIWDCEGDESFAVVFCPDWSKACNAAARYLENPFG